MVKDSVVMPILKELSIAHSYNRDKLDGFVINCVLFRKIAKVRENGNGMVFVEFPMDDIEPQKFLTIKSFKEWLVNNQ